MTLTPNAGYSFDMTIHTKKGVLLLNLGGPEKIEDIRPFLYNLFSDRQIIRLGPSFFQKPIAALIAWRRAPKSAVNYSQIGGGSPLRKITDQQSAALEQALAQDGHFAVRSCMRYWQPCAKMVLTQLVAEGVKEIIALPLYPHYSIATSGSSFSDLERTSKKMGLTLNIKKIHSWPAQPQYIDSLATKIKEGILTFAGEKVEIVYSAHSLPVRFINEGDPYVDDLQKTITALEQQTGRKGHLCYQSRSGPVEWLGPSTPETIKKLAQAKCKNLLIVPISFVSDHVETLYELDIQYRKLAEDLGMGYKVTSGLNTEPLFIEGLRQLVLKNS